MSETVPPDTGVLDLSLVVPLFDEEAWYRAIYADDQPVGFAMLEVYPDQEVYGIWRFMIAAAHQGRGYGRKAIELLVDHVRGLPGATALLTSHVTAPGDPGPFYEACGFSYTGEVDGGERIMSRPL